MTSSPRFDIAIVLIPRKSGDSIAALGEPVQTLKDDPASLAAVEETLDALDRAFHPVSERSAS